MTCGLSPGGAAGVRRTVELGDAVAVVARFGVALGLFTNDTDGADAPVLPLTVLFVNKTAVAVTANTSTTKLMTTQATIGADDDDGKDAAAAWSPARKN